MFVVVELREFRHAMPTDPFSLLIWWLMLFVASAAIVLNVLKDPAVCDSSFWLSRPIGFVCLFVSKFLICMILSIILGFFFVLAPVLSMGAEVAGEYLLHFSVGYAFVTVGALLVGICARTVNQLFIVLAAGAAFFCGIFALLESGFFRTNANIAVSSVGFITAVFSVLFLALVVFLWGYFVRSLKSIWVVVSAFIVMRSCTLLLWQN